MLTRLLFSLGSAFLSLVPLVGVAAATDSDRMMEVLLRPAGWSAEWSGPGGAGLTEVIFERRADKIFVKIKLIVPFELTCESPVTVDTKSVTFDGCRDPSVTLVYDPVDSSYPLRGRSPRGYEWKVKPK